MFHIRKSWLRFSYEKYGSLYTSLKEEMARRKWSSLVDYSPWGLKELDTTEVMEHTYFIHNRGVSFPM